MIRYVAALIVSLFMMVGLLVWLGNQPKTLPAGPDDVVSTAEIVADEPPFTGPSVDRPAESGSFDLVELHPQLSANLADLQSTDPTERAVAAVALAASCSVPAVCDALTQTLGSDPDPVVRTKVAYAMGRLADPLFVEPLRSALVHDRDARVRGKAAWALGELRDPAARIDLRDAARRDREVDGVRCQAMAALTALGDEAAARALVDVASSPGVSEFLRDQAIQQLASMGEVAVEPMLDAMRDLGQPLGEFADNFIARHGKAAANVAAQQLRRRLQSGPGV
jgi:hypothetical protein